MKNIGYILLFSLMLFSSCIRDEIAPCPPLRVNLTVKDKNYFNVERVVLENKRSEDLAFNAYVPTLYYQLRDAATGEVVDEKDVFAVSGDDKTFPVAFCDCLPHGKYILTVWGGLKEGGSLSDDALSAVLHADGEEGDDLYMANDTLLYDAQHYDYTIGLQRTKGKLIIQAEKLPASVNYGDVTVSGLFRKLDCGFHYSDQTSVHKQPEWGVRSEAVVKTVLAPSTQEKGSRVNVKFYDKPERVVPALTPKEVNITMKRNELTVLRYVYEEESGNFIIYILMNDSWDVIYDMEI